MQKHLYACMGAPIDIGGFLPLFTYLDQVIYETE